jgi:hypothetical protein
VGQFLQEAALHVCRIPTGRWVDDFFAIEPAATAEHAMQCFERVVVALMGAGTFAQEKMVCSNPIDLLGLTVSIAHGKVTVCPNEEKQLKWLRDVSVALDTSTLCATKAEKLAGRLSFAAQNAFHRLGRAMLRPIYQQQHKPLRKGALRPLLEMSLAWWQRVLSHRLWQTKRLGIRSDVVDIFCDAASTPARLAAVYMGKAEIAYTEWTPPAQLLLELEPRRDQQICALELMAIALGEPHYTALGLAFLHELCIGRPEYLHSRVQG